MEKHQSSCKDGQVNPHNSELESCPAPKTNDDSSSTQNSHSETGPKQADEETSVSMIDVLKGEQELEEDANAVLGDSDDKNCTYSNGYVSRQALYSCLTCLPVDKGKAGVCLACCLTCHEGHNLVELYTKRNFRCDCGTPTLLTAKCKLDNTKTSVNEKNIYNQNFHGVYCTCHRPYPDDEDDIADEMIQCIICEDWYHTRHLNMSDTNKIPKSFEEMVCQLCMKKCDFLWSYYKELSSTYSKSKDSAGDESSNVEVCSSEVISSCCRGGQVEPVHEGATFWPSKLRSRLCSCPDCLKHYSDLSVSFLTDPSDSVHSYEKRGLQQSTDRYEKGMEALKQMNHSQQVNMLTGFNNLKNNLKEYLKKFAENGKVVREEDINEFFCEIKSKKQNTTQSPQYFCR